MGSTHLTTGVTSGAWFAAAASLVVPDHVAVLAVPVVAYAALLPDLDHPRAMATRSLWIVTMAVSFVLRIFVEHRGATHRIEAAPLAFGAVAALGSLAVDTLRPWFYVWGLAVALGVATHIWADARTRSGVPWAGRWWRWGNVARTNGGRLRIGRVFATGSKREKWLAKMIYRPVAVASLGLGLVVLTVTS